MKKHDSLQAPGNKGLSAADSLIEDIRTLIEETRSAVAVTVNAGLTVMYWQVGKRIQEDVLKSERASYGDEIVSTLSRQLTADYGRGFSEKSLRHMIRFAEAFPDERIVSALMRQLSWTHFLSIIYLLFYHRGLNRLIAIDLKLGDFKAEYKGQMELYLRWLDKHDRRSSESAPLGIILCAGKKQELIELLELDRSGIHVAEYLTELPSKELLSQKLHAAIEASRKRLENREEE